jgi:hypothetical protein
MARMTFMLGDEFALKLSRMAAQSERIAKTAIHAGASIVADEIRANIEALPTEEFRYLREGDQFEGITATQKNDLLDSLGITPILQDNDGNWNAKVGFDGYGSMPTRKYPKGLPNQLIARAAESGSSVRRKHPFVRPAVNAVKRRASEKMEQVITEEMNKIMK